MLDNNLCATKCEVKQSSTFHKVRIAVAAPDCRRALPNPSRPSPAVAWPKPDSRTRNNQPRRDAQSCNLCSHENLVCLFSLHMFGLNGSAFKETQPVIPPIISCINIQLIMLHDALPLLGVSADMDGGSSTTTDTDIWCRCWCRCTCYITRFRGFLKYKTTMREKNIIHPTMCGPAAPQCC